MVTPHDLASGRTVKGQQVERPWRFLSSYYLPIYHTIVKDIQGRLNSPASFRIIILSNLLFIYFSTLNYMALYQLKYPGYDRTWSEDSGLYRQT
jgi:hypothetical protein